MKAVCTTFLLAGTALFLAGLAVPQRLVLPVRGATRADWNPETFWHSPWGASGVHKGIDIFAREGTPVFSAGPGLVLFAGQLGRGGNAVVVMGPKWRLHYYAHLRESDATAGHFVSKGETLGTVGATGNAVGKPPHLHYALVTPIPYPWHADRSVQGWKKMFYLNPFDHL